MSGKVEFLYLTEEEMIEAGALNMSECITKIEEMFDLLGQGDFVLGGPNRNDHGLMLWFNKEEPFPNIPLKGPDRRFMSLISYLGGHFDVVGNKWYGSNIENTKKGLPRSIHTFTLNDKDTGAPLSIMAGNLVSSVRTGAVPGVISKHLAKEDAEVLGAVGGGVINQSCIDAILTTVPTINKIVLYDIDLEKGEKIADRLAQEHDVEVEASDKLGYCVSQADIITVATSGPVKPKINAADIKPGALILLTGSASFDKAFYKENRIVADYWPMHEKWLEDGLNHPDGIDSILDWTMSGELLEMIHNGEYDSNHIDDIGDIISGKKTGRKSDEEVIVCFTGGLPTEDIAWGHTIYKNALEKNLGTKLPLWQDSYLTK